MEARTSRRSGLSQGVKGDSAAGSDGSRSTGGLHPALKTLDSLYRPNCSRGPFPFIPVQKRVYRRRLPPLVPLRGRRLDAFEPDFLVDLVRLHSLQYTGRSVSGRKGSSSIGFPHPAHLRSNTRTSCIFRLEAILSPHGAVSTTPVAVCQDPEPSYRTRFAWRMKAHVGRGFG